MTVSLRVFHRKSKLRIARRSLILPLFHFCMLKWHPASFEQVLGKVSQAAVCRFILSFILMGLRRGGKCKKPECQQMWVHHGCQPRCWAGTASWVPAPEGSTPCGLPGRVGSCGVTPLPISLPSHTPLPPCSYSLLPESTAAVTNIWKDELTENRATFHGGRTTRSSQPHFSETAPCFL